MNRPWWQQMMEGLDFETTGVDVRTDRIVTGCMVTLQPQTPPPWLISPTQWTINPGIPIPKGASDIHGITDEMAVDWSDPGETIPQIVERVRMAVDARIPIVGMNLAYDLSMLYYESNRYGRSLAAACPEGVAPVIDALVLDKQVDPYRKGGRKLTDLCRTYDVRIDGAHDSTFDALAAARVVYRIASRHDHIGNMDPMELHRRQIEWRAAQCASLEQYFRKKDPKAVVDRCWPICRCEPGR